MSEPLRTSHSDGFRPWQTSTEEQDKQVRPAKRARVALACQRCKSRKQKVGMTFVSFYNPPHTIVPASNSFHFTADMLLPFR